MSKDRLEETFAPLREQLAPAHLRTQPLTRERRNLRPVFLVAVGAIGCALVGVSMWPRPASAAGLLEQAKRAFQGHSVTYVVEPNGRRMKIGEGWYAPGRSRISYRRLDKIQGERFYDGVRQLELNWNLTTGSITWRENVTEDRMSILPSHLDPQALSVLVKQHGLEGSAKPEASTFEGRPAQRLEFGVNGRRVRLFAHPQNLTIVGYETEFRTATGKMRHELTVLQPEMPSDAELAPTITFNDRTFNAIEERARIKEGLEKPLATGSVEGAEVEIRQVAMNNRHDLFVLYTGAEGHQPVAIRDDAGGTYLSCGGFAPTIASEAHGSPFMFAGKPLQGTHFVREGTGTPTRVVLGFRKDLTAGGELLFQREFSVVPTSGPLLDFLPFMAMAPMTEDDLVLRGETAKMFRAYNAKDWPETERWVRRVNTLEAPRERRYGFKPSWRYVWLAEALANQGRKGEAVAAIREARKRFDPARESHVAEDLATWEKKLGVR